ncbi:hypothetical protein ACO0QE_003301 [Hanseniaspora vineae]
MDRLNTDFLRPPQANARRRGLSVSTVTDQDKFQRNSVLNTLSDDLQIVRAKWGKEFNEETNPLELAMLFLDNTSVGLGFRFEEFNALKYKIEKDLQEAVNEHYQTFNSVIASYRDVENLIHSAQDTLHGIKTVSLSAVDNIKRKYEGLDVLNEEHLKQTKVIETLEILEVLISFPTQIDAAIAEKRFFEAQSLLDRAFDMADSHNVWSLSAASTIRQQLQIQKTSLFDILVEEMESLIYVKNVNSAIKELFGFPKLEHVNFNDLENYFYQLINIDVSEKSKGMNSSITQFLKKLGTSIHSGSALLTEPNNIDDVFRNLHQNFTVINNMNEMGPALDLLSVRLDSELHNIVLRATDTIRVMHPAVIKILSSTNTNDMSSKHMSSARNIILLVLKEFFWDIFSKFLFALQAHFAVYEISRALQPVGSNVQHDIKFVWLRFMEEITHLLNSYLISAKQISGEPEQKLNKKIGKTLKAKSTSEGMQLFSLAHTSEESTKTQGHVNEMSRLLKEMLPGFDGAELMNASSIYLSEEVINNEETLVKPSAFNIKYMLEPFLVFIEGSKKVLYPSIFEQSRSPTEFFEQYMSKTFFDEMKWTLDQSYAETLEAVNPFLLEQVGEEEVYVFRIAANFKNFFEQLLSTFGTSSAYRPKIAVVLMEYLSKFLSFLQNFFQNIVSKDITQRSLLAVWFKDKALVNSTQQIYDNPDAVVSETQAMMTHCAKFYEPQNSISHVDFLTRSVLEHTVQYAKTLTWLVGWLKDLKKVVLIDEQQSLTGLNELSDSEKLKQDWNLTEQLLSNSPHEHLKFSLSEKEEKTFDKTLNGYKDILNTAIIHIRYNLRAKSIYYISKAIDSTYWCTEPTTTRVSENIITLNTEITLTSNTVKSLLTNEQHFFIFNGLSEFISNTLVLASFGLPALNKFGYKSLMKNFEIIQQSLKFLVLTDDDRGIEDAIEYYQLFKINENRIVDNFNAGSYKEVYTYGLVVNMLRLILSEDIKKDQERATENGLSKSPLKRLEDLKKRLQKA